MNDWRKGHKQMDLLSAALRHLYAHIDGEDIDKESGLNHLSHCMTNLVMISTQINEGTSVDDRYRPKFDGPKVD